MAKIDFSKIPGYSEMSAEQKLSALEDYEIDMSQYVSKSVFDKKASEAADLSKQLKSRMTEDEQEKAQQAATLKAMQDELDSLRRKDQINGLVKRWMGAGYSETLASSTAQAMADGNLDQVFKDFATFIAEHDKAMRAELIKKTPTPPAGAATDGGMKREDFAKLSLLEKQKFAAENPEIYKSFYE